MAPLLVRASLVSTISVLNTKAILPELLLWHASLMVESVHG